METDNMNPVVVTLFEERSAVQPAPVHLHGVTERLAVHDTDVDPHCLVKILEKWILFFPAS
jgi:hypothetical protein